MQTTEDNRPSGDVVLGNGRVVVHKDLPNDAQEAYMQDGNVMSDKEWTEYCDIVAARLRQ